MNLRNKAMTEKKTHSGRAADLRNQAEDIVMGKAVPVPEDLADLSPEEARRLAHELQVHKIELEVQNEELQRAQEELEAARMRYFDLYDLAPVAYVTLSETDLIQEANLTAARLLGETRAALVKQPLSRFILKEDQDTYYLHCKQLSETRLGADGETVASQAWELRMLRTDGAVFWAHLEAAAAKDENGAPVCRVVVNDITERRYREEERELTARLIALINTPGNFRKRMSDLTASLQGWSGCEAVGIRLRAGDDYPYYETRGFPPAFVHEENHLCAYGPDGKILRDGAGDPILECMCGNILCGRFDPAKPFFTAQGSFWSNNTTALLAGTTEADRQGRTRNRCNGMGYESVALIPLRAGFQVFGLLQFNDHRPDRFTPDLVTHFERLADSLAIALSRRQAEEELRKSERKLLDIIEFLPDATFVVDLDGKVIAWNRAMEEMTGVPKEEMIGQGDHAFAIPFYGERRRQLLDLIDVNDEDLAAKYKSVQRKGNTLYAEAFAPALYGGQGAHVWATGAPLFDDRGNRIGAIESIRDVSERREMEAALQKSEWKYRTIYEDAVFGIYQASPEGRFISVNNAFARMAGYDSPEELIAAINDIGVEFYVSSEDRRRFREIITTNGMITGFEAEYYKKDGTTFWVLVNARAVTDEQGQIIYYEGIAADVSQRKRAEEEQAKLEAQLQQAQKMESVGRLAGGVAHDFNNMLGVIIGHAEMALDQTDPAQPLYADLEEIRTAANRSADLTRQLLAFARKQTITPKLLDLNKSVAGMLKMLRRLIGENIRLNWHPEANLWPVKVDPSQIDQILTNLCLNARDAISDIGEMTIETGNSAFDEEYSAANPGFAPGEYVLLAVSDNGFGMDKEALSHLFEPFYTTKVIGKGTGLGLATVYGIVRQNNGFINVYSEPDQGTTFKIYLPRKLGKTGQQQAKNPEEAAGRGHETILLVEDEPSILAMTTRMLVRQGYTVLAASTPGEAIRLARERDGEINLLMTDVVMPEMNGRDLAQNLLSLYPNLKRLFMSGYTANVIAHHGVLDEGVCFIQKPFSIKGLAAKVREALDHT
jgi:two-component system, cell cycle sensor histidine kinase and response regulator CckA